MEVLKRNDLTPVTEDSFRDWKKRKVEQRKKEAEERVQKALSDKKGGGKGAISGRDLFTFDPSLFVDDDNVANMEIVSDEEDEKKQADSLTSQVQDASLFLDDDLPE